MPPRDITVPTQVFKDVTALPIVLIFAHDLASSLGARTKHHHLLVYVRQMKIIHQGLKEKMVVNHGPDTAGIVLIIFETGRSS